MYCLTEIAAILEPARQVKSFPVYQHSRLAGPGTFATVSNFSSITFLQHFP